MHLSSSRNTFYHFLGKETTVKVMTILHNITILIFDGKKERTVLKISDQNYIDNKLHSSFFKQAKTKIIVLSIHNILRFVYQTTFSVKKDTNM